MSLPLFIASENSGNLFFHSQRVDTEQPIFSAICLSLRPSLAHPRSSVSPSGSSHCSYLPFRPILAHLFFENSLFSSQIFPSLYNDIDVLRIILHQISCSSVLFAGDQRCPAPPKQVKDNIPVFCVVLDLIVKKRNRFHCWVQFALNRSVKIKNRCLLSVACPKMCCAVFPSIQARLMLPLVILSSHA